MDHLTEDTYTNLQENERGVGGIYETLQLKTEAMGRGVPPKRKVHIPTATCFGLLCVAVIVAVVCLSVRGTMDKTQLEKSFYNLSQKSDILENAFGELKQEMDMLQISLNNLSEEIVKLQGIISELVEGRCPESWLRFNSSCYVISAVTTTWNEGRQNCTEKDADLVIINSKAEQEYLNDMVKNFKEVWIGLSDSDNEGMWKWVDGTPLTESLKFWKSGEPNDSNGNEDCAVLSRQTQSSPKPFSVRGNPATLQTWNDIPCYRSLPFICERKLL